MLETGIVWLRTNLRLADNPSLHTAFRECTKVRVVYLIDQNELRAEAYGSKKWGAHRLQFTLEALRDIHLALCEQGNALEVIQGDIPAFATTLKGWEVSKIYCDAVVAPEEIEAQDQLKALLPKTMEFETFWNHTLYHPGDIPFEPDSIPNIFTNFRKVIEQKSEIRAALPNPQISPLSEVPATSIPTLEALRFSTPIADERSVLPFTGGERAALRRLEEYIWTVKSIHTYKLTRNQLLGANYSSKFSPWLAQGAISARTIYHEIKKYEAEFGANDSTYWLYFELLWRDYFWFITRQYGSKLFQAGGINGRVPKCTENEAWLTAWKKGETGIPFVDANMRELNATGFMSNRGRQNAASFLVKDLKQDWRKGAAYFEQQLIDYDVHSNWGNWAYVAGVGNDPRENRYFNVLSQAQRYDTDGDYVKHWLPELNEIAKHHIHTPWLLKGIVQRPICIPVEWGL